MDLSQLRPRPATVQVTVPGYRPALAAVLLRPPLLVGYSTTPAATKQAAADFPGIDYFREFGDDGADADALPELPPLTAAKLAALPEAVAHVSWKDDVEQLAAWRVNRPVYLTWWHEPPGDKTPAEYKAKGARVTEIIDRHPDRQWILGHGPVVPRYWLDEGKGNPTDWGYPGMTFYGVDAYSRDKAAYWPASRMFGPAFAKIRAAYPGIRLLVPEYGLVRTTADTTGVGRATAIRDHLAYLREQPDVDAVAYWSNTVREKDGTLVDYRVQQGTPEAAALRAALA